MKLKRFEILLPLNYNDGGLIEPAKYLVTHREILEPFGATTIDSIQALGTWMYLGTLYQDRPLRIGIDSPNAEDVLAFMRTYKEILKTRFRQIDIWIAAHDIEIIRCSGYRPKTRTTNEFGTMVGRGRGFSAVAAGGAPNSAVTR